MKKYHFNKKSSLALGLLFLFLHLLYGQLGLPDLLGFGWTTDLKDQGRYDSNGKPAIEKDQLSLATILDADNETQVEVTESIPSDTPPSGYIRVTDDNGFERRLHYNDWENGTPNRFYNIDKVGSVGMCVPEKLHALFAPPFGKSFP